MGVALCLLGSIVGARDVSGHAVPVSSDPAPNATLSEAPHEVVIRFSERVDARASHLEVLDAHGQRVDHGDATVPPSDPWRYRVGIHGVADGVYTVAWRVLSADDGHVTDGAHVFAVGTASAPGCAGAGHTPGRGGSTAGPMGRPSSGAPFCSEFPSPAGGWVTAPVADPSPKSCGSRAAWS